MYVTDFWKFESSHIWKKTTQVSKYHINFINITFFKVLLKLIKLITDIYYIVFLWNHKSSSDIWATI